MSHRKGDKKYGEHRSVEEVILRRKLEKMVLNESKSMPALNPEKSRGSFLPAISGATATNTSLQIPIKSSSNSNISDKNTSEEAQKMYSEKDVRKMMENVMKYCRVLQTRVQELEVNAIKGENIRNPPPPVEQHHDENFSSMKISPKNSNNHIEKAKTQVDHAVRFKGQLASSESHKGSLDDPFVNREIVASLDSKIGALRDIFRQVDPMEERRSASIKIQAIIRGFLARARKRYYYQGVREWRWVRCRPVIWVLDILLSNQSKLDSGFHLLTMNRTMKTLKSIYTKWAAVYRQNAPMRRAMRRAADEKIRGKRYGFLLKHFVALREVTIGLKSRKHANNERRKMIDQIRANLSKKLILGGDLGVVPDSEIMKALNRRVVEEFQGRKDTLSKMYKFKAFKKLVDMAHAFQKAAQYFRFRQLAGRCFYAWSDNTYLKSRGLDRKRWPGPRKYEVRYNQKRVDNFARVRCERLIFQAWKAYFAIQHIVKMKFQHKVATFQKQVFLGWKAITKHQHSLRLQTYQNWVGYAALMTEKPFKAWADFVKGQKNQYQEHLRIAKSYRRWKSRQKLAQIVKVWRHLALFGRLDGLYTRQMLLKTLGEQKMFTSTLEKLMSDQTLELDECKKLLQEEVEKRKHGESEITQLNSTINHMKMTNHHYEQELKRLTATVESMALINPKQMQHMQEKMPEFKFRERHIALGMENEELLGITNPTATGDSGESSGAVTDSTKDKDSSSAATVPASEAANGGSNGNDKDNKESTSSGGDTHTAEPKKEEGEHKPLVDTAQSLAMKLLDNASGNNTPTAIAGLTLHHSGAGGSSTPTAAGGNNKAAVGSNKDDAKASDPDQLPPAINTLENQRMLERVKWILERYKACNPMNFDFDTTKDAPAMNPDDSKPLEEPEPVTGVPNPPSQLPPIDDTATVDTATTAGGHSSSSSYTGSNVVVDKAGPLSQEPLLEAAGEDTDTMEGDLQHDGITRPSTRGSMLASTSPTTMARLNSSSKHMRSNSYMAIANSSLPGLKLPDASAMLQRSPSKSLLRASNPFVKGMVPGEMLTAGGGGDMSATSGSMMATSPPFSPPTESPSSATRHFRSKSKRGKSMAFADIEPTISFDDSPSSPAGVQVNPRLTKTPKSFRASFSRQSSASFTPAMFSPALQAINGGFNANNSQSMPNEHLIMAMGYDPSVASPSAATGGAGEVFYGDDELEDIVITWAKMLFTILEFLESGDITNLPMEDKRLWALHLLRKERLAKNTLSMEDQMALNVDLTFPSSTQPSGHATARHHLVDDPHALVTQALHNSTRGIVEDPGHGHMNIVGEHGSLVEKALMTVDERVHGGVSWREALLKLRTMFPGAGNFSGFGVAIEEDTDTAFFQRLLQMRKDLQKVENVQTQRFQRNMLQQMAASEQEALLAATGVHPSTQQTMKLSPAKKSLAEWKAEKLAEQARLQEKLDEEQYYQSKRFTSHSSVSVGSATGGAGGGGAGSGSGSGMVKPLGTDIYASNLKKLLEVERAEAEAEAAAKGQTPMGNNNNRSFFKK